MSRKSIADLESKIAQLKARKSDLEKKQAVLAKREETSRLIAFARFLQEAAGNDAVARTASEWVSLFRFSCEKTETVGQTEPTLMVEAL